MRKLLPVSIAAAMFVAGCDSKNDGPADASAAKSAAAPSHSAPTKAATNPFPTAAAEKVKDAFAPGPQTLTEQQILDVLKSLDDAALIGGDIAKQGALVDKPAMRKRFEEIAKGAGFADLAAYAGTLRKTNQAATYHLSLISLQDMLETMPDNPGTAAIASQTGDAIKKSGITRQDVELVHKNLAAIKQQQRKLGAASGTLVFLEI